MIILIEKVDINFWAVYSLHFLISMEEAIAEAFTKTIDNMLRLIEREHLETIKALNEVHESKLDLLREAHEQVDQINNEYKAHLGHMMSIMMTKRKNKNHDEDNDLGFYPKKWIKKEDNNNSD